MPATITSIDWFEGGGSSFRREMNAPVEYRRTLLITGLSAGSGASSLSQRIDEAEDALAAGGFAYNSSPTGYTGLKLVNYEFSTLDSDTTKLKCVVTYANRRDALGPVGTWTPRLSGTLNQIQTAKDYFGIPISVRHTYPVDDVNFPGETITQGGVVPQQLPLVELTYTGLIQPQSITLEAFKYLGRTNSTTWNYGPRGTWLCTNFQAQPHEVSTTPDTWLVDVTFQADPSGWYPLAVFTDPATGQQPENLVPGFGIVRVRTQPEVDFNDLIPSS